MNVRTYIPIVWGIFAVGLLGGCVNFTDLPTGTVKAFVSPVLERRIDSVSLAEIEPPASLEYVIGINDTVNVTAIGGDTSGAGRVDGNGNIQLPVLGMVRAAGFTTPQLARNIEELLKKRKLYKEPWVVVQVTEFRSQPLQLVTAAGASNIVYMDHPMTLLEGVTKVGISAGSGVLKRAQLLRNNRLVPIDIYSLVVNADMRHNIWLKPGDTIFVPEKRPILVFGAGGGSFQSEANGTLPLDRVMAQVNPAFIKTDLTRIRIIRSLSTTSGELIIVDFEKCMRGEALPFLLQEGDLVYIPRSKIETWYEVFNEITPVLTTFSTVLQPYVTIKYLFLQ